MQDIATKTITESENKRQKTKENNQLARQDIDNLVTKLKSDTGTAINKD